MWPTLEVASLGGRITQTYGACLVVMVLLCTPYFIYVLMIFVWMMAAHLHIIVRWWLIGMWWYDTTTQLISIASCVSCFSNKEVCGWPVASDLHEKLEIHPHLSYEEEVLQIMDYSLNTFHWNEVPMVKVLWSRCSTEEATCECEDKMWQHFPCLFASVVVWDCLRSFILPCLCGLWFLMFLPMLCGLGWLFLLKITFWGEIFLWGYL